MARSYSQKLRLYAFYVGRDHAGPGNDVTQVNLFMILMLRKIS